MKKLLPIYGHIFPLHFTPFNGRNNNASAKSITLSQKFQDLNFSNCLNKTGINSTLPFTLPGISGNTQNDILLVQSLPFSGVNELGITPEDYSTPVSVLWIEAVNSRKVFRKNQSASTNTNHRFETRRVNLAKPGINAGAYRYKNSTLSTMSIFRYNHQNTF